MTNTARPARRRPRRHSNGPAKIGGLASLAAVILMFLHPGILTWAAITAAAVAVAYLLGRLHASKPAPRRARPEFGRAAARQGAGIRAKADSSARRNGWLPPANPKLATLALSPECAGGECHLCDGCEHKCSHDAGVIVARNEAAYDASHPGTPPF